MRQQLGLRMGLAYADLTELADAVTTFPTVSKVQAVEPDEALARRQDLLAASARVRSAEILVEAAEHNTLARLDLRVSFGYAGLSGEPQFEEYFAAIGKGVEGVNGSASLIFELPVENRTLDSDVQKNRALHRRAMIGKRDLERRVRSGIAVAQNAASVNIESLVASRQAIDFYSQAVDNETQKLQAGLSTVIDLVVTQDRLDLARLAQVQAELRTAVSLAQLAFESGALPTSAEALASFSIAALTGETI